MLACRGELDLATQPGLRRALTRVLDLTPDRVVVDLSRVSFLDAGIVGLLVRARTRSRAVGGDLVVRWPSSFDRRLLDLLGLHDLIAVEPRPVTVATCIAGAPGSAQDDLAAAWATACAADRYGATPLVFDAPTLIAHLLAVLDDPSTSSAARPARRHETSAATAVMQLWALRDVLQTRAAANGAESAQEEQQRHRLEEALTEMAAEALAELERTTLLDPLTGLLNRRALDRDLVKASAFARRNSQCLSVVMIDVDGLKATNDRLGHAAGDDTLRRLAASLVRTLRVEDSAYRIGGDEFVLVLPDLCPEDVEGLMERTVDGVQGAYSWGCAWLAGDEAAASDADRAVHLLQQADQRMLDHRARDRGSLERVDARTGLTRALDSLPVELAGQLAARQRSSVAFDEAKGLIAEHFAVSITEASIMLAAYSAAQRQSVQDVAVALMARGVDVASLAPHRLGQLAAAQQSTDRRDDTAPTVPS